MYHAGRIRGKLRFLTEGDRYLSSGKTRFLARIELNDASVRFNARLVRWRNQFNPAIAACLFDHLVRSLQDPLRNHQSDLLGGLEIDHKLEFLRLLDGKIGGPGAFKASCRCKRRRDGTGPQRSTRTI